MNLTRTPQTPSVLQRIGGLLLGLIILEVVVLSAFGTWPTTRKGWILLLVLGPPAYLLAEWISDRLMGTIEKLGGAGGSRLLSWRRVLVALIALLMLISLVVLVLWVAGVNLGM